MKKYHKKDKVRLVSKCLMDTFGLEVGTVGEVVKMGEGGMCLVKWPGYKHALIMANNEIEPE